MSDQFKIKILRMFAEEAGVPFPYTEHELMKHPDFLNSLQPIYDVVPVIIKMFNDQTGKSN